MFGIVQVPLHVSGSSGGRRAALWSGRDCKPSGMAVMPGDMAVVPDNIEVVPGDREVVPGDIEVPSRDQREPQQMLTLFMSAPDFAEHLYFRKHLRNFRGC